jgi:acyl carrier protein
MNVLAQPEFERLLTRFLREAAKQDIRVNTPLFAKGLLDSMQILDLLAFIEASLDIRIPDRQVTLANFRSVQAISRCFWKGRRRYAKS